MTALPASIDSTGSRDVSALLLSFLASVPDGDTVDFPQGKYRIEDTLRLEGRSLTLNGNGSTFFAMTPGDRTRALWRLVNCHDIILRGMAVCGAHPNPGTYVVDYEAQHGFDIQGCTGVLLEHIAVDKTYGDPVNVKDNRGTPSGNVIVQDFVFGQSGRQGVSITGADGVTIQRGSIDAVPRSAFDLEPDTIRDRVDNVVVSDVELGNVANFVLGSGGRGGVGTVTMQRVHVQRDVLSVKIMGKAEAHRGPFTVTDCSSEKTSNHPPCMTFSYCDGVTVKRNRQHFASDKPNVPLTGPGVRLVNCTSPDVADNDFAGLA